MVVVRMSRFLTIILFTILASYVSGQEGRSEPQVKHPVPEKVATDEVEFVAKEALALTMSIHAKDAEKSFQEGLSLAKSELDPAKKWVVLQLLLSEAVGTLKPINVMRVVADIEESFDFAPHGSAIQSLLQLEKKQKRPEDRLATIGPLISSARKAMGHSDFDAVKTACSYDVRRLPRQEQKRIQQCLSDLQTASNARRKFVDSYADARMLLAHMPDDESANLMVALYECTLGNNFRDSIDHLSKSGNKGLQAIARLELGDPKSREEYKELGDLWWELANEVPESCRKQAILRSASWYEKSLPLINGVDLVVAKKRIETSRADGLIPILRFDLLRTDLRRLIRNGRMDEKQKQLQLGASDPSYCQFFQPLIDNYDLEYKFTRNEGRWGFAFIFFAENRPFMWNFGGSSAPNMGFEGFQGIMGPKNSSKSMITDRQTHTLLLRVRADRFEAILDGNLESDIRNPLDSQPLGLAGHPVELSNAPHPSIVDWWGFTTVESATYTEYW